MKVIAAIDIMDGQVVRLYRGDPHQKTVYSDDPEKVARRWEADGADMLHVVDLDAAIGTGSNLDTVERIARAASVPVEVAGGLRSERSVARAVSVAARAVIGTIAFRDRDALSRLAERHGASRLVVSVDHSDGFIVTHGWQERTRIPLIGAIKDLVAMGLSEFLLTDVGRDGTMRGPDLAYLGEACSIGGANVIASGGISGAQDIEHVRSRNAHAVILGRALYEEKISIREAKRILAD